MRTVVILQVRLDSTRLPGKALLPLSGIPMAGHAMAALKLVKADAYLLATDAASAPGLEAIAERFGFRLFIGPKEDVLSRFCQAARASGADRIVRATGDNPLVSYELASLLLERRTQVPADYSGYLGMPKGMGVEVIEAPALFEAERLAQDPFEREHVAPYLYRRPERFRIDQPRAPGEYLLERASVSVDTPEDYEVVKAVFASLYAGSPPRALDVIAWFKAEGGA